LATDFDRNRNAMIEGGKLEKNATESCGPPSRCRTTRSRPARLPALADRIRSPRWHHEAQAKTILPKHYTASSGHAESYRMIEDAESWSVV